MIKGITIRLIERLYAGKDMFNRDLYEDTEVAVENVLVAPVSSEDAEEALNLYGKKAVYTLGIPKGDTHVWEDTVVILPEPFAGTYHTIGYATAGIDAMIPLSWNKKVQVEKVNE